MSIYQDFCTERVDENGVLTDFSLNVPENFNFGYDVVDRIAAEEPGRTAMVWCNTEGEEHTFTFADMSRLSNQAANVLAAAGIGRGDTVMLALKRHYEYWYTVIALHKLGAVAIPVTHMLTTEDLVYRIQSAGVKAIICTPNDDVPMKVRRAVQLCRSVRRLWTVQRTIRGFRNLTEETREASPEFGRRSLRATDPMFMYFTSGTTGYPKAVIHDQSYPLSHIVTARYWQQVVDGGLHLTVAETGWAKTSWGKLYGQWLCGSAVMVYDFDNFEPKQLMSIINEYQVTTFCAPPTVYRYLVRKGMVPMPSLVHASTAGEALAPEVFIRFQEHTGLQLMEGFGQTETALILGNFAGMQSRPGSMGKPSPMYNVKLLRDDGSEADTGEIGELVIVPPEGGRQLGVFVGYHDNAALYSHVWRGGVYHTGDTAWRDEDGYYWFNGRIDDVIKTGGFRVGPYEIENVLMEHPAVMECSVVGVQDPLRGQAIKAFVVLSPGFTASSQLQKELREFCNDRLAEYKWVRFVDIVETLPKTISGKIRKVELRGEKA